MIIAEALELRGETRGKEIGKEIGITDGKIEVAINMLKNNMPINQIADLTSLDKELIIKLSQEIEHKPH